MRKLFYENSHLQEFSARVTGCQQTEKGWLVTLDATAFYPEGGGQACDIGTLGGVNVLDVREKENEILHLCDGALEVGSEVFGKIDWQHRFDLMQQHTGEHIVSGLLHEKFGYHNTGFHVGKNVMEVDFDGPISPEDLAQIERRANEAIWANLPVKCWYPSEAELSSVPYRRKRDLLWPVRIVEIPGSDSCACCGVHVEHTGEIGLVKLISAIPCRGGTRMEMACGRRALAILNHAFDQNRQVSQAFSAQITETGAAARRMNEVLAEQKYRIAGLEKQIFQGLAQGYTGKGDVVHFEEGLDSTAVRELADAIAETCAGMAAVFSGSDGEGYAFCLMTRQGDLRQLCKDMDKALNGRGGGKPNFQQGRVQAARAEIEAFFHI